MSRTIAVVISEPFLRRLAASLAGLARRGADFRIIDSHRPTSRIRSLVEAARPALILTEWIPATTVALMKLRVPAVIAASDRCFPGAVSLDVDDRMIGRQAAEHFLASGYRHFGFVGLDTSYAARRLEGFRARLEEEKLVPAVYREREPRSRQYLEIWREPSARLKRWLGDLPKPAAIFAAHDPLGRLVCEAGREGGLSIPEDIAVIGANNDDMVCPLSNPPLSSIAIPWARMGTETVHWVEALLRGQPAPGRPILFPPGGVVARQSTTLLAVDDPGVRRILQAMRERYEEPVTVEILCSTLRLTRRTIERRFSTLLGATPWEILTRFRLERARTLLTTTDQPIGRIAEACGFNDAERFATTFRGQIGISPSRYRAGAG